jgi:poly-gamma-glutamate synthesis protein (capsule biosynthesis protein)
MIDGKLIIYSLGNYLMLGAASLDGNTLGKDYGLFTRAYFGVSPKTGRLKIQALEAIPLRTMHVQPRPMDPENAARHIDYLNELSRTELGDSAVRFNLRHNGTGVACDGSATEFTERAAAACADYVTPRLR